MTLMDGLPGPFTGKEKRGMRSELQITKLLFLHQREHGQNASSTRKTSYEQDARSAEEKGRMNKIPIVQLRRVRTVVLCIAGKRKQFDKRKVKEKEAQFILLVQSDLVLSSALKRPRPLHVSVFVTMVVGAISPAQVE